MLDLKGHLGNKDAIICYFCVRVYMDLSVIKLTCWDWNWRNFGMWL